MRRLFFFVLIVLTFLSCDPERIYESNVKIPAEGWRPDNIIRFEVEITDTISPCNIFINVRNNNNYKYTELWLFVDIKFPTGIVDRDTSKIALADHRGKWLGHGLGSKFDSRLYLRKNVLFPAAGTYIFEYQQASRDNPLIGIEDIGLRIERVQLR